MCVIWMELFVVNLNPGWSVRRRWGSIGGGNNMVVDWGRWAPVGRPLDDCGPVEGGRVGLHVGRRHFTAGVDVLDPGGGVAGGGVDDLWCRVPDLGGGIGTFWGSVDSDNLWLAGAPVGCAWEIFSVVAESQEAGDKRFVALPTFSLSA
jgi:hypothetical protein